MQLLSVLALAPLALASPMVERRQYSGMTTENQFTDGTPCREITILFARGTSEKGNVGSIAGPPMFQDVANKVGANNVAVQGVDYPATVPGFFAGGDANGSKLMAQLAGQIMEKCPDTKLSMSGYSQGGQLVHNAADMLTQAQTDFVNSVVIFGDPNNGKPVGKIPQSKVLEICHDGDNICHGGTNVYPPHLTYGNDAQQAADFVVKQAQA